MTHSLAPVDVVLALLPRSCPVEWRAWHKHPVHPGTTSHLDQRREANNKKKMLKLQEPFINADFYFFLTFTLRQSNALYKFIHSFNHFIHKIHTHPHVQVTSFLSTVAEHNVRISIVEGSPLRWVKEHSLHLLHPPDPQPWVSHFMGKLALCCTQIKHPGEGGEKEGRVCVYVEVGGCFMRKATSEERRR